MPGFRRGDVVRVPFPYTDRETRQHRPALVVSDGLFGEYDNLLWVLMITSAGNRRWRGDIPIPDHAAAGLPAPSVIRTAKIATIEDRYATVVGQIGDAGAELPARVESALRNTLGLR